MYKRGRSPVSLPLTKANKENHCVSMPPGRFNESDKRCSTNTASAGKTLRARSAHGTDEHRVRSPVNAVVHVLRQPSEMQITALGTRVQVCPTRRQCTQNTQQQYSEGNLCKTLPTDMCEQYNARESDCNVNASQECTSQYFANPTPPTPADGCAGSQGGIAHSIAKQPNYVLDNWIHPFDPRRKSVLRTAGPKSQPDNSNNSADIVNKSTVQARSLSQSQGIAIRVGTLPQASIYGYSNALLNIVGQPQRQPHQPAIATLQLLVNNTTLEAFAVPALPVYSTVSNWNTMLPDYLPSSIKLRGDFANCQRPVSIGQMNTMKVSLLTIVKQYAEHVYRLELQRTKTVPQLTDALTKYWNTKSTPGLTVNVRKEAEHTQSDARHRASSVSDDLRRLADRKVSSPKTLKRKRGNRNNDKTKTKRSGTTKVGQAFDKIAAKILQPRKSSRLSYAATTTRKRVQAKSVHKTNPIRTKRSLDRKVRSLQISTTERNRRSYGSYTVRYAQERSTGRNRYFEKHQSHSYQSSKYSSKREYERDRPSSYRDRDISPGGSGGGGSGSVGTAGMAGSLNNGNSYRSQSPDIDSPSSRGGGGGNGGGGHGSHDLRDRGDHRGSGRGGSGERYSYIQKMRDRDRDVHKKEKYSDKRDRRGGGGNERESESYRTNHDRERRGGGSGGSSGAKLCSSRDNDKRSGSDDRERERDRDIRDLRDKRDRASDRDRDMYKKDKYSDKRERGDRGERVARCGDWSEHVSSSGKMYYYNCKTEVSQWEKPKEWLDRERNLPRDPHREKDYRDKDRDRDREDRFSRSAYTKHSSSRDNSRLRWNYENNDGGPPSHRRRLDGRHNDNADMDISGDSTPTSEASYSLTGTPTTTVHGSVQMNDQNAVLLPGALPCAMSNALPRLTSHPNSMSSCVTSSAPSVTTMHFQSSSVASIASVATVPLSGNSMLPATGLASVPQSSIGGASIATMPLSASGLRSAIVGQQHIGSTSNATVSLLTTQGEHHLNSNAPGPPSKIMTAKEQADFIMALPHKSSLIMRHLPAHSVSENTSHHMLLSGASTTETVNHVYNSANAAALGLRENPVNSPLYNLTHPHHSLSPSLSYTKSPITAMVGHTNNVNPASSGVGISSNCNIATGYSCNPPFGLKADGSGVGVSVLNASAGMGAVSGISVITSMGSNSLCSSSSLANISGSGLVGGEGPPTPTQELDLSGNALDQQQQLQQQQQRKLDGTASSSLSTLQSCVSSSAQAGNLRGPEISPKLAKFFRVDLISHVTNWQAEALERQTQKCSEDTHLYGDLTCTKICADLKCARSLVRSTEISATLQEQKIMYLRQQIRRLEESKMQNSFMSDDT